jgi:hypothetical protein
LNNPHPHEVLPSNQKIKPSKLKSPSNAFQSRHRLSLSNNPDEIRKLLLTDDALIEIMSNTLKHAASSMFVTSFTTSAAFFTNILTNISFVQVFGVFTGTCILLYFIITVTAIAAFAVSRNNFHHSSEKFLFFYFRLSTKNTCKIFPLGYFQYVHHPQNSVVVFHRFVKIFEIIFSVI